MKKLYKLNFYNMNLNLTVRKYGYSCLCAWIVLTSLLPATVEAQTVVGGSTPDPSAILDVQSSNKGFLFPHIPNPAAITQPATGLIIFNTTSNCMEINMGTPNTPSWQSIKCSRGKVTALNCSTSTLTGYLLPASAASGVSVSLSYTGGNGRDYDAQSFASTGITGLTANLTAGTFATGNGNLTLNIQGTGGDSGLADFALDIGGQTCTLTIPVGCGAKVSATEWKVFECYNRGSARTTGDPFTPSWDINGAYWQWGKTALSASGPSNASTPNAGAVLGWSTTPAANNSWLDTNPMGNNPCAAGFRVPTKVQWQAVVANNTKTPIGSTWTISSTNFSTGVQIGSNLMLPATGFRNNTDGVLMGRGGAGYYWSSTQITLDTPFVLRNANYTVFGSDGFIDATNGFERTFGISVRCIKE